MKLVRGFGFNDADYVVRPIINGRRAWCPAYVAWQNMLERCYSEKLHKRRSTYIGVTVCDKWRSFMKFREWWLENHVDGWQLDKDLLTDSREYSPDSCIYIPLWLNSFTVGCDAARGEWPIGVDYHKASGMFRSQCGNPSTGKSVLIGLFKTPEDSHLAWKAKKLEYAAQMKNDMDAIDMRIYHRIVEIINRAR